VLPADPYAQLELAQRIAAWAYSQKVGELEADNAGLRDTLAQRGGAIKALERRNGTLEVEIGELHAKARRLLLSFWGGAAAAALPARSAPRRRRRRRRRPPSPAALQHAPAA